MTAMIALEAYRPGPDEDRLRAQVRAHLDDELEAGRFTPSPDAWMSAFDAEFSRRLGERGWLAMTMPRRYGGHGRSALERFVVVEELLAAGARRSRPTGSRTGRWRRRS